MFFRRTRGSTADLMVSGSGTLAIVRVQNAMRLYATVAEIEWEFLDTIARLRVHPSGGPVSRELWLYSRYGVLGSSACWMTASRRPVRREWKWLPCRKCRTNRKYLQVHPGRSPRAGNPPDGGPFRG
jgi:hypothetical protein